MLSVSKNLVLGCVLKSLFPDIKVILSADESVKIVQLDQSATEMMPRTVVMFKS